MLNVACSVTESVAASADWAFLISPAAFLIPSDLFEHGRDPTTCDLRQLPSALWSSVSPWYSGTDGLCLSNIRRCDGEDTFENTVPELGDVFLTKEGLSWEVLPIWKKHVGLGIRKKTISYSKSILRGFLSAGLSLWWGSRTEW